MKKLLATMLIAAMTLSLAACSNEETAATVQKVADAAEELYLKDINPSDYVTLGDYKNLTPSIVKEEITDEQVQSYVESLPSQYPDRTEVTGRAAQIGDVANIDYEGKLDGVAFEGGTAQGYDLSLGSGTFIPGFEDGVVGMEIGSTKDIDLTFPTEYGNSDLAGKAVVFTVKLNALQEETVPKLDDAFAQKLGETDLEGLKASVKASFEQSAETDYQNRLLDDIENQILASSTFKDIPEAYVNSMYNQYMDSLTQYAAQAGASEGQVASYFFGVSEENYQEGMKEWAAEMAKKYIMLGAIAAENNITITPEEVDKDIQDMLSSSGSEMSLDEYKAQMNYLEAYSENMLVMKVEDYIITNLAK